MRDSFCLEALVDFPDDALSCPFPITRGHIDAMMSTLAQAGIRRVIWGCYGDGHGGFFLPAGIGGRSAPSADQGHWHAYSDTIDILGNPLRVAVEAAHRHGMEVYAYYKPYETGAAMCFPEGSPQAREWGRLPLLGGYLTWLDPFVVQHPHLRIRRRSDDLPPGVETATIHTLRLTKKDDSPTRVTAEHLQIWASDLNYRYHRLEVPLHLTERVEPSPREVRDAHGTLLTRRDDPVRVLTLSGLHLDDRYILVRTDFADGPADFTNAWDRLLTAYDAEGREIPGVYATGTAIWFPEWEDFRHGGLNFDTGCGPDQVTLDLPHGHASPPEEKGVRGCIAFTRGRNAYLPGCLCETEPQVQSYWLSCVREMLDAGVDGIELRVENHSSHTDTPQDYGFNPAVLAQVGTGASDLLQEIARVRGGAYTEFLRRSRALIAARGKRMRVNLNVDWFRPADQRPPARKLAYPANIDFNWREWVDRGLLDQAMLRPLVTPFSRVFGEDPVAYDMVERCRAHGVPVTLNRYVWRNPDLLAEFKRALKDGRFAGFVLYETCSYLTFTPEGQCVMSHLATPRSSAEDTKLAQDRAATSATVQDVCDYWRSLS